jgi:tripartite-type tricarboxylate transporter receptor subunit TctC
MSTPKQVLSLCAGSIALLGASVFAPSVTAQEYPTKTIRIISPVPAGGLSDIAMRPMALELQKRLGQPVIIENRPGAGGTIAGRACAQAAPDGYTFCNLFNDVISNAPYLFKNLGYDPQNDFVPITNVYFITSAFLVTPDLGVNTVAELIELSKKRPDGLNMGAPSTGAVLHIKDFNLFTGSKFQPIPYRSGGEVANALLTNTVQAGALGIGNLVPHVKAGKFKVLAVDSATRSPLLPDVPTLKELGLDHTRIKTWYGFLAPKGTPPAIIRRLRDEIVAIYKEPAMHERSLINAGLEPDLTSTEEFMGHLARIAQETAAQAKRLDVKPE